MRRARHFVAALAIAALAVSSSGCILSRLTDRAFVGIHTKRATYPDRMVTGLFLLPITAALDLATFPIQAILLAIAGDDFVLGSDNTANAAQLMYSMSTNPKFQQLSQEQQVQAVAELDAMVKSGQMTKGTVLALTEDGHWVAVETDAEARSQMLARAHQKSAPQAVCSAD